MFLGSIRLTIELSLNGGVKGRLSVVVGGGSHVTAKLGRESAAEKGRGWRHEADVTLISS